jgi:hypothetical protein
MRAPAPANGPSGRRGCGTGLQWIAEVDDMGLGLGERFRLHGAEEAAAQPDGDGGLSEPPSLQRLPIYPNVRVALYWDRPGRHDARRWLWAES